MRAVGLQGEGRLCLGKGTWEISWALAWSRDRHTDVHLHSDFNHLHALLVISLQKKSPTAKAQMQTQRLQEALSQCVLEKGRRCEALALSVS